MGEANLKGNTHKKHVCSAVLDSVNTVPGNTSLF